MTKKTVDKHGTWRHIFVGFDVSNAEYEEIRRRAAEKGMSIPVYMAECLLVKDVKVKPSRRAYEILTPLIAQINDGIERIGGRDESQ